MKKFSLLTVFAFFSFCCNQIHAQNVVSTPGDSIDLSASISGQFDVIDEYIFLHNHRSDSVKIAWRLLDNYGPGAWTLQLCDNNNCYSLPGPARTASAIAPGDSLNMHAVFAPNCTVGSGAMHISAKIVGDTLPALTLTYHLNVTTACLSGIEETSAGANLSVFPNPANDQLTVNGIATSGEVVLQVSDITGKVLSVQHVNNATSSTIQVGNLPPGLYFVSMLDAGNKVLATRRFSKL